MDKLARLGVHKNRRPLFRWRGPHNNVLPTRSRGSAERVPVIPCIWAGEQRRGVGVQRSTTAVQNRAAIEQCRCRRTWTSRKCHPLEYFDWRCHERSNCGEHWCGWPQVQSLSDLGSETLSMYHRGNKKPSYFSKIHLSFATCCKVCIYKKASMARQTSFDQAVPSVLAPTLWKTCALGVSTR